MSRKKFGSRVVAPLRNPVKGKCKFSKRSRVGSQPRINWEIEIKLTLTYAVYGSD